MGFYIEGPSIGKAEMLIQQHGATRVTPIQAAQFVDSKGVIAVVSNLTFDAALFCVDRNELSRTIDISRPVEYLVMDRELASTLSGHKSATDRQATY